MPTYAYRCSLCGHQFDAVQKFSEAPLTECPECAGEVRRIFQPAGIVFKGSGWYINDSRGGAKTSGSSKSETSTESAPAATAESAPKTEAAKPAESKPAKPAAD